MYQFIISIILCALLCAQCKINDTQIVYRQDNFKSPKRLAFTQLSGDTSTHNRFDKTDAYYVKSMQYALKPYKLDSLLYIDCCLDFNNQNTQEIINICSIYNVDAVLVAQLKFESLPDCGKKNLPVSNFETEVEIKLYGADGKLKMHTLHNTLSMQSYHQPPKPIVTIKDGVSNAVRKLAERMSLEKVL